MEFIENKNFKMTINDIGGSLCSLIDKRNKEELIHQINDGGWPVQDVMIFPLIGQYEFEVNNKIYNMPTRHGFIRNKKLEFNKIKENEIIATYISTDEDLVYYPYKFKYEITYILDEDKYILNFKITNLDAKTMHYSIGNHLGIKTNNKCYIDLKNNQNILLLKDGLIDLNEQKFEYNKFKLEPEIFSKYDTLVFKNNTKELMLVTITHRLIYRFEAPLIAIWQNPSTNNFVCIEPWWGIASYVNNEKELEKRAFIEKLDPNNSKEYTSSITILLN